MCGRRGYDCLKFPLGFLKFLGQHPNSNSKKGRAIFVMYLPLLATISVLVTVNLFKINPENIKDLAETFEAFMTFCQMTMKIITIHTQKKQLASLMRRRKRFWPLDVADKPTQSEMLRKLEDMLGWLKLFGFFAGTTIVLMTLKAFISEENELPMACWMPAGHPSLYYAIFLAEVVLVSLVLCFVIGFDGLFAMLCTELVVQFKLLHLSIRSAERRENGKVRKKHELRRCVEHHDFLLRFCNDIQNVYSLFFLAQFSLTTISACMELYIISESLDNYKLIAKSIFYVGSLLTQFVNFCWPAANLTEASLKIGEAIYGTNWYESGDPKKKNYLPMIIGRSQRMVIFRAAGVQTVNWEGFTIVRVFKTSFSFFTLMRSLK